MAASSSTPSPTFNATKYLWIWPAVILPIHLSVRIAMANRLPIMDCDETFNYWEVVHFLLFGKSGSGDDANTYRAFQTWEYSNEFALRTYAYLMPLVGLGRVFQAVLTWFGLSSLSWLWPLLTTQDILHEKVALFVLLRASLGAWMAWAEVSFTRAIAEQGARKHGKPSKNLWFLLVALVTECLLLTSAGMGHAAAALLPSSTLMGLWMFAAAAFLRWQHTRFIVLAVTATLAVGWPFGVIMFVPLGLGVLFREYSRPDSHMIRMLAFFLELGLITAVIQAIVMTIDYQHYGRVVSPVWNILIYNTASGGDELYGVEPFSYYVKNLILNLNYVAIVGIVAGFLVPLVARYTDGLVLMLPVYLWLAIVAPRPHKEERFLFPIYPAICFGAALFSAFIILGTIKGLLKKKKFTTAEIFLALMWLSIVWGPAALISSGRLAALSKYYSAPLSVYARLPQAISEAPSSTQNPTTICTCGEWYRFASSFYIPDESAGFGFAPSTFGGQLPQRFAVYGSGPESAAINKFNDNNEPERGSLTSLDECDFLVELSTSNSCTEQSDYYEWRPILQVPFLDADSTTSALHRVVYIPKLHEKALEQGTVSYSDFVLYSKEKIVKTEA